MKIRGPWCGEGGVKVMSARSASAVKDSRFIEAVLSLSRERSMKKMKIHGVAKVKGEAG